MTSKDSKQISAKDINLIFESAVLPSIIEMIEVVGKQNHMFDKNMDVIIDKLNNLQTKETSDMSHELVKTTEELKTINKQGSANEKGFSILADTITSFGSNISKLIDTNNELVNSQKEQIMRMDDLINTFEENTARMDRLTLTIQNQTMLEQGDNSSVFSTIENDLKNIDTNNLNNSINNTPLLNHNSALEMPVINVNEDLNKKIKRLNDSQSD